MQTTCEKCGTAYDDARRFTTCPHHPLMSDEDLARKDAAIRLLGYNVRFASHPDGAFFRIESVSWDGYVTLREMPDRRFTPDEFVIDEKGIPC